MAKADCPQCGGTGWKVVESTGADGGRMAVRCECAPTDRTTDLLQRARIPRHFADCDFDNFEVDLVHEDVPATTVTEWNRTLGQAKTLTRAFARDFPVGDYRGLLFMGRNGVGKTHLAVAALKEIVLRGHSGLFYDYRDLLKQIQASWNPDTPLTEMDVLRPVLDAEVLLLDDLGGTQSSQWALETLGHIFNSRYNERRVTLATTNLVDEITRPPDAGASNHGRAGDAVTDARLSRQVVQLPSGEFFAVPRQETLADRVGPRIRSRLYEMCRTIEIAAPDYRKEIRQADRFRA